MPPRKRRGKEVVDEKDPRNPVICPPSNTLVEILQQDMKLIVYEGKVGQTEFYYGKIFHGENAGNCVVLKKTRQQAHKIFDLLMRCINQINILTPIGGVWEDYDAYLAFPAVDGALSTVPKEKIFWKETTAQSQEITYGFVEDGYKMFQNIMSAVQYINNLYHEVEIDACLPIKIDIDSILFQEKAEGGYHVMLGDFDNAKRRKSQIAEDLQRANWKSLGRCLRSLYSNSIAKAELNNLVLTLESDLVNYDELLWEPGTWEAHIKMKFIREITWNIQRDKRQREAILKTKTSLGLASFMRKFGMRADATLFDSVTFLRNMTVAHHDEAHRICKDVGEDKATFDKLLRKDSDDYMIKLVKKIRELGWINNSPLVRCENSYMDPFNHLRI